MLYGIQINVVGVFVGPNSITLYSYKLSSTTIAIL
jgi:hypothetical protein